MPGRRRQWLDDEQSPHKPEHTAEAPRRRDLAQSGLGAAEYAAGLNGALPSHSCSNKHKLGMENPKLMVNSAVWHIKYCMHVTVDQGEYWNHLHQA